MVLISYITEYPVYVHTTCKIVAFVLRLYCYLLCIIMHNRASIRSVGGRVRTGEIGSTGIKTCTVLHVFSECQMAVRVRNPAAEVDDLRLTYRSRCGGIFRYYVTCGINRIFISIACVNNETK